MTYNEVGKVCMFSGNFFQQNQCCIFRSPCKLYSRYFDLYLYIPLTKYDGIKRNKEKSFSANYNLCKGGDWILIIIGYLVELISILNTRRKRSLEHLHCTQ